MVVERRRGAAVPQRKTVLLRAAAELFAARGFRAVSIDAIGQAAGISGPGVYRHFATKADILLALCHEAMDHLLDGASAIAENQDDPRGRLTALISLHADFAARERAILAVYLREQRELPARDLRGLRVRQRDYERAWVEAMGAVVERPDAQLRAVVKLVLSMLNGSAHLKDGVPRSQLVALLANLAAGALREVGVELDESTPAA